MKNSYLSSNSSWTERERKGIVRLVVIIIFIILIIVGLVSDPKEIRELRNSYQGREFTDYYYNYFNNKYGPGSPTSYHSQMWIYYYPKGDFTMMVSKDNNRIIDFYKGR